MNPSKEEQLKSEQAHAKREWKNASTIEKVAAIFVPVFGAIAAITVTLMIFFFKGSEPCDIDKVGLWCKTHPFTGWDVAGLILFYIGTGWLTSILPRIAIRLGWIEDDSDKFPALNWASFILAIAGFAIIYTA